MEKVYTAFVDSPCCGGRSNLQLGQKGSADLGGDVTVNVVPVESSEDFLRCFVHGYVYTVREAGFVCHCQWDTEGIKCRFCGVLLDLCESPGRADSERLQD
jgi:hypothetical protein